MGKREWTVRKTIVHSKRDALVEDDGIAVWVQELVLEQDGLDVTVLDAFGATRDDKASNWTFGVPGRRKTPPPDGWIFAFPLAFDAEAYHQEAFDFDALRVPPGTVAGNAEADDEGMGPAEETAKGFQTPGLSAPGAQQFALGTTAKRELRERDAKSAQDRALLARWAELSAGREAERARAAAEGTADEGSGDVPPPPPERPADPPPAPQPDDEVLRLLRLAVSGQAATAAHVETMKDNIARLQQQQDAWKPAGPFRVPSTTDAEVGEPGRGMAGAGALVGRPPRTQSVGFLPAAPVKAPRRATSADSGSGGTPPPGAEDAPPWVAPLVSALASLAGERDKKKPVLERLTATTAGGSSAGDSGVKGLAGMEALRRELSATPGERYRLWRARVTTAQGSADSIYSFVKNHTQIRHDRAMTYHATFAMGIMTALENGEIERAKDLSATHLTFMDQVVRDGGKKRLAWLCVLEEPEPLLDVDPTPKPAKVQESDKFSGLPATLEPIIAATALRAMKDQAALNELKKAM